ncbi:hypothetical protein OU415_11265 [Saccharopolyspora sp. WRP15-2]|uniref:Uncharacterized protein n=1 Tax=Saccharopolyspora oryzae TaxID=2997343 RepID=A0ABT4UWC9_9PSEU|nr:hypothetical protein [Saccharopolyspora oryzae]MDA3626016.1 hypothetical protein [Saccharopolyspora oryzae]
MRLRALQRMRRGCPPFSTTSGVRPRNQLPPRNDELANPAKYLVDADEIIRSLVDTNESRLGLVIGRAEKDPQPIRLTTFVQARLCSGHLVPPCFKFFKRLVHARQGLRYG